MRKEEIRHDPIRENIVKGVEYLKYNQNIVFKIFAGLIILVAVFSYYNYLESNKIGNASNIAGLAQNTFINGNRDEAMVKFERVMDDYPGTYGASQSLIYLLNDAITQEDYEGVSLLISQYKGMINNIDDQIVKSNIYKIQGDIALIDGNASHALSFYRKAESTSQGSIAQIKYKLDIISVLLTQRNYGESKNILENILELDDIGYNERNKVEELLAFVNYKIGT